VSGSGLLPRHARYIRHDRRIKAGTSRRDTAQLQCRAVQAGNRDVSFCAPFQIPSCAANPVEPNMFLLSVSERVGYYVRFYRTYAIDTWDALSPMQYGALLIGIGVFGWILMKNTGIKG